MISKIGSFCTVFLLVMIVILCAGSANAEDAAWRVSKMSGDVSVTSAGVPQAALTNGAILKPGDSIRSGQNGRVLLVRGEETIYRVSAVMISSVIPSARYSCSFSPLRLVNGRTAIDGRRSRSISKPWAPLCFGSAPGPEARRNGIRRAGA